MSRLGDLGLARQSGVLHPVHSLVRSAEEYAKAKNAEQAGRREHSWDRERRESCVIVSEEGLLFGVRREEEEEEGC
jgi:hypothetical protein